MAKLSIELLQSENQTWTEMSQSIIHSGGKVIPFGKYMNCLLYTSPSPRDRG